MSTPASCRRVVALLCGAVLLAGGCALPPPETPAPRPPASDWSAVQQLGRVSVIVTLETGRILKGRIVEVTEAGMVLSATAAPEPFFLSRESIVRVVHVRSKATANEKRGAVFGGILGVAATITSGGSMWLGLLTMPAEFGGLAAIKGWMSKQEIVVFERQ